MNSNCQKYMRFNTMLFIFPIFQCIQSLYGCTNNNRTCLNLLFTKISQTEINSLENVYHNDRMYFNYNVVVFHYEQRCLEKTKLIKRKKNRFVFTWLPRRNITINEPSAVKPHVNRVPNSAWVTGPYPWIIPMPVDSFSHRALVCYSTSMVYRMISERKTANRMLERWQIWNERPKWSKEQLTKIRYALHVFFFFSNKK